MCSSFGSGQPPADPYPYVAIRIHKVPTGLLDRRESPAFLCRLLAEYLRMRRVCRLGRRFSPYFSHPIYCGCGYGRVYGATRKAGALARLVSTTDSTVSFTIRCEKRGQG